MGGFLNVVGVRSAFWEAARKRKLDPRALDPWFFPSKQHYQALLEKHGFQVDHMEHFARPTLLPGGMDDWLRTLAGTWLRSIGPKTKAEEEDLMAELVESCRVSMQREDGSWVVSRTL